MEGRDAPADGVITGYGRVDGRMVAVCAYDFTVMAGLDGDDRRAQGHAPARARADPADPVRLAARLRRRADPGGGRLAVRRLRPPVPRGGRDERRDPAGRGAHGPVRGGHRVHPGPRRLRPDGQGPRLDGARRAAPRARRDRRGRHAGGARRVAGALAASRASATSRSRDDEECIARHQAVPVVLPVALRAAPAGAAGRSTRSTAATRPCSTSCPTRTASRTTCTR